MIWVLISTSSPTVSVAAFDQDRLLASRSEEAPMRASGTALRLLAEVLEEAGVSKETVGLWAADLGPGSFTGVKVGVTLAKTLAFAFGTRAAGFASFDLIDTGSAGVPSRKGMYLVRDREGIDELAEDHARVVAANTSRPSAENGAERFSSICSVPPEELMPNYVLEPSISKPKEAFK